MRRALITGAGRFVAPYLADHLRATESEVWGTCLQAREGARTSITELDVRDASRIRTVFNEIAPDEIYYLAVLSRSNLPDEAAYWDVHLHGTLNVLAAGKDVRARVLQVGSACAYGHPVPNRQARTYRCAR